MRKSIATAVILAVGLSLSACAVEEIPIPKATSGNDPEPVMSQEAFTEIAKEAKDNLAAADKSRKTGEIGDRIAEPLKNVRHGQYTIVNFSDSKDFDPIVINPEATPIFSGTAFPRTAMTVAGPQAGENLTTLSVWSQDSARSNMKLWADVEIFPGVKTPDLVSTMDDTAGYPAIDAKDYAVDPAKVVDEYVAYNQNREQAKIKFKEDDPLTTALAKQQDNLEESIGDVGSAKTKFSKPGVKPRAVSTSDGGLLLVGQIQYKVDIKKNDPDATLRLGGELGAMASRDAEDPVFDVENILQGRYSAVVAFYIPPAGEEPIVEVVGASSPTLLSVKETKRPGQNDNAENEETAEE